MEEEVGSKGNEAIQKTQRKYVIQEQSRAWQKEWGDDEEVSPEIAAIRDAIEKANMPEKIKEKINEEFEKLNLISPTFFPRIPWLK